MWNDVTKRIVFYTIMLVVIVLMLCSSNSNINRVRRDPAERALSNDARQIGGAAQQYFLTTNQKTVSFSYNSDTGKILGPLEPWLNRIAKGYTVSDSTIELGNPAAFTLSYPKVLNGQPVTFSDEGKTTQVLER